ncbi:BamA/TamA family outer membrane protein [Mangrovibacterium diazotrophicum]|uniref:Surface antigen-like variable number repeat protein n=1 Tax=Mangrovibacterium diazotrophicum TaxID=1261403 RepID=A0A419W2M2_9BACT|nr:hypothetical protein [Mangrovibacterium diazotrophicum]RKD89721.1 hypothetical protein BC643_0053 [Mangrovibacterium diazotrophicum]
MGAKSYILFIFLLALVIQAQGEHFLPDTTATTSSQNAMFPDSVTDKIKQNSFTRFVYERIVSEKSHSNELFDQYERLESLEGKKIASITIKQLDIFGPTFEDTAKVTDVGIEKFANKVHTRTSERIIQKNILFHVGDELDPERILENERIIRLLPFIKDVRIRAKVSAMDTSYVEMTVITKDVFAFGMRARFRSVDSGEIEMYNQNIWGAGHQIAAAAVTSVDEEPNVGFESSYSINNIRGHFVNLSLAYANTYRREGVLLDAEKQFLRTSTKWGGGLVSYRLFRSDRFYENDALRFEEPLDYRSFDAWAGYAFQVGGNTSQDNLQLVLAGRYRNLNFYERPDPGEDNNQLFSNSNFYMASIALSRRYYIRDHHILGYGITEDIPKGFLHEFVLGFDDNEATDRWYSHLYFSSGNLINYKPSYMFLSVGLGSFFNANRMEQGQFELNWNYISRQFRMGAQLGRQFLKLRYVYGINRFDQENLTLKNNYGIRGFYSDEALGQQRLVLSTETVIFQRKSILNFNFAFFGFADLGIIGSADENIFTQNYYTGIGGGVRLRNESLIFRTIQLRLSFYPGHPPDASGFGFSLRELSGTSFYSFQPRKPEPLQYK